MEAQYPPLKNSALDEPRLHGLLLACRSDDPREAMAAIDLISNEDDPAFGPFLLSLIPRWQHDPYVLEVVLDTYEEFASSEAAPVIFPFLHHPHPGVAVCAVSLLDAMDDARLGERALEEFLRMLERPHPEVVPSLVYTLAQMHDWRGRGSVSRERVIDVLARLLDHPERLVRVQAAERLVWSFEPGPGTDALMPGLLGSSDPAISGSALARRASLNERPALDRLLEILRGPDPDGEFVSAAGRVGTWGDSNKMKRVLRKELKRLREEGWAGRGPENRDKQLEKALSCLKRDWLGWFF